MDLKVSLSSNALMKIREAHSKLCDLQSDLDINEWLSSVSFLTRDKFNTYLPVVGDELLESYIYLVKKPCNNPGIHLVIIERLKIIAETFHNQSTNSHLKKIVQILNELEKKKCKKVSDSAMELHTRLKKLHLYPMSANTEKAEDNGKNVCARPWVCAWNVCVISCGIRLHLHVYVYVYMYSCILIVVYLPCSIAAIPITQTTQLRGSTELGGAPAA